MKKGCRMVLSSTNQNYPVIGGLLVNSNTVQCVGSHLIEPKTYHYNTVLFSLRLFLEVNSSH